MHIHYNQHTFDTPTHPHVLHVRQEPQAVCWLKGSFDESNHCLSSFSISHLSNTICIKCMYAGLLNAGELEFVFFSFGV